MIRLGKLPKISISSFRISQEDIDGIGKAILILLAITTISYGIAGLFYDALSVAMLRNRIVPGKVRTEAVPLNKGGKQPADAYALIPQRNLFGSTDKAVAEKNAVAATAMPDISTLVEVKGTIAGSGKDGFAILEEKGKNKQLLYKVGNVVAGATIVRIIRNAVVFLVDGQEKTLKIAQTNERPLIPARSASLPVALPPGGGPLVVSRNEIDASLKDMGTLLSQAQIRPYYAEGVPDGFMISNIRPGSVYERIGLMNGDVIQGADDRKLITAEDVTSFYNSMKTGSSLSLKILRGGRQENLQFVFR